MICKLYQCNQAVDVTSGMMPDDNQNKIPKHSQSITQQCSQYI